MATPDGIVLDSCVETTAVNFIGPVVRLDTSIAAGAVADIVIPFRTADRVAAGGADKYVCHGQTATGSALWSLRLHDNGGLTDLNLYDSANTLVDTLYLGFAEVGADTSDDQWFVFRLVNQGGTQYVILYRALTGLDDPPYLATTAAIDAAQAALNARWTEAKERADKAAAKVAADTRKTNATTNGEIVAAMLLELAEDMLLTVADDEPFILHPGEFVLGQTVEWVELPDDLVARLDDRRVEVRSALPPDQRARRAAAPACDGDERCALRRKRARAANAVKS